jgi:hypothetical protein
MAELTTYVDTEVANGDPIVVVAHWKGRGSDAVTLGTGFTSMEDLSNQLKVAVDSGSRTRNINEGNAQLLRNCDEVDIFTIDSHIEFE